MGRATGVALMGHDIGGMGAAKGKMMQSLAVAFGGNAIMHCNGQCQGLVGVQGLAYQAFM